MPVPLLGRTMRGATVQRCIPALWPLLRRRQAQAAQLAGAPAPVPLLGQRLRRARPLSSLASERLASQYPTHEPLPG